MKSMNSEVSLLGSESLLHMLVAKLLSQIECLCLGVFICKMKVLRKALWSGFVRPSIQLFVIWNEHVLDTEPVIRCRAVKVTGSSPVFIELRSYLERNTVNQEAMNTIVGSAWKRHKEKPAA